MMYNIRDVSRLASEADIYQVLDACGIRIYHRGSIYNILCPSPEHNDHHADNCYFRKGDSFVYCTVCQRKMDSLDIIKYSRGLNFMETVKTLWEMEGCPSWFCAEGTNDRKAKHNRDFNISPAQAAMLGITLPVKVSKPICYLDQPEARRSRLPRGTDYEYSVDDGFGVALVEEAAVSWKDFFESENQFKRFVLKKMDEKISVFEKIAQEFNEKVEDLFPEELKAFGLIRKSAGAK